MDINPDLVHSLYTSQTMSPVGEAPKALSSDQVFSSPLLPPPPVYAPSYFLWITLLGS